MIKKKEVTQSKLDVLKISYAIIVACITSVLLQFVIKDPFLFITTSIILGLLSSFIPNIFYKTNTDNYKDLI